MLFEKLEMYVNGKTLEDISEETDLPVDVVKMDLLDEAAEVVDYLDVYAEDILSEIKARADKYRQAIAKGRAEEAMSIAV